MHHVKTAQAAEILGVYQNRRRKWAADGALPIRRNTANGYQLFNRAIWTFFEEDS
jgi:hypothetical protein